MSEIVTPNPADFSVNEKLGEYRVCVEFSGEVMLTISAGDSAAARAEADKLLAAGDFDLAPEDFSELEIISVRPAAPMYRVLRNRPMGLCRKGLGMTRRPLPTSIGLATLGLLALPLYAVQRLPWRDPMSPAAAWTTLGVYVAIAAAGVWVAV